MDSSILPDIRPISVSQAQIDAYRRDGFVKIPGIITPEEAAGFHTAALAIAQANAEDRRSGGIYRAALNQTVDVWPRSEVMRRLSFHPNVIAAASALAGVPLRLWHDQILCKDPQNGAATQWHQDQPYWPLRDCPNPISAWIALCDVPAEMGCMSFMPGQQHRDDLPMQILTDPRSLFDKDPALEFAPSVTIPLRAGDCTFHHGRTPHMAGPNQRDAHRLAHVVIFIDREARMAGDEEGRARGHVMTNGLDLRPGDALPEDRFPAV